MNGKTMLVVSRCELRARFYGLDAGASAAIDTYTMSEGKARAIIGTDMPDGPNLSDVIERFGWSAPDLSGEWADDPTPDTLQADVDPTGMLTDDQWSDVAGDVCTAWEAGAWEGFTATIRAHAYRVLGSVEHAFRIEQQFERMVDALRPVLEPTDQEGEA